MSRKPAGLFREFQASHGHTVRPCLSNKQNKGRKEGREEENRPSWGWGEIPVHTRSSPVALEPITHSSGATVLLRGEPACLEAGLAGRFVCIGLSVLLYVCAPITQVYDLTITMNHSSKTKILTGRRKAKPPKPSFVWALSAQFRRAWS